MNEAVLEIILSMRDEASEKLVSFTQKLVEHRMQWRQMALMFTVAGAALWGIIGYMANAADKEKELAKQMKEVKKEWDEFAASVGKYLIPVLKDALHVANQLLDAFNKLPEPLKKVGAYGMVGGATFFTGAAGLASTVYTISTILKWFGVGVGAKAVGGAGAAALGTSGTGVLGIGAAASWTWAIPAIVTFVATYFLSTMLFKKIFPSWYPMENIAKLTPYSQQILERRWGTAQPVNIKIEGGPLIISNESDMQKFAQTISGYQSQEARRNISNLKGWDI